MDRAQWQAAWIWASEGLEENNVYVETRKRFDLASLPSRAVLRISANQTYRLYINGHELGRGPAPADLSWMSFDTYDIGACLHNGPNAVAIIAHNFGQEEIVTQQLQGPGGVICQIDLFDASDAEVPVRSIASGADWPCRRSPRWKPNASRLHLWGGYREIIDLQAEDGWELAAYDDSAWPAAVVVARTEQTDAPWPRLLPREIPLLQETLVQPVAVVAAESYLGRVETPEALLLGHKEAQVVVLDASTPGSLPQLTYDFGSEIVGFPELELQAEEGGVVQLFYGESLELLLTDTFLLKKGLNRLTPMGRRAFRYLKIAAMATPAAVQVHRLDVRFVHYPFEGEPAFRCSDDLLNRIWETGRYTTVVNSQHHFEDCPHREAALWVADAVVMAKVVYQTYRNPDIVRKSLLQAARIQNKDGSIPGTGPHRNQFLLPDFCAFWLLGAWEYYAYSGDDLFLQEIWPHAVRLAAWFEQQEDESGLFAKADRQGWWCFIDWSDDIERRDRVTAISCYYYKFLQTIARMADTMQEPELGRAFLRRAERLRMEIRTQLRVPGTSVYADCLTDEGLSSSVTAQTNFAAAWSGIMEEGEVIAFVQDQYAGGHLPPIRGAFFYHIVLETLFRYAFAEEATRLIRSYWGAMLERGATTWWETFDLALPFPTTPSPYMGHTPTYLQDSIPVSLSHGWGASPTYLLSREILGADLSEAGTGKVAIRPTPAPGIDWAEGVIPTKHGDLRIEWHRQEDGSLIIQAAVPAAFATVEVDMEQMQQTEADGIISLSGVMRFPDQARSTRAGEDISIA
ncbi:alpha-L-rhamnosidase N-terminal domain-containing protein [Paenibacillus daejeonensis]|uniref:alpha-L-rhamnosidase-related protein n=1 Tax=Paenibacillus daejeonensis TaxID=135193 RepID=UPI000379237A|nr:alpha-L-rhamnosidase N-terminal domain-containing protein [Paenibacillus daejeonensis]